jgi:hypothetical protein
LALSLALSLVLGVSAQALAASSHPAQQATHHTDCSHYKEFAYTNSNNTSGGTTRINIRAREYGWTDLGGLRWNSCHTYNINLLRGANAYPVYANWIDTLIFNVSSGTTVSGSYNSWSGSVLLPSGGWDSSWWGSTVTLSCGVTYNIQGVMYATNGDGSTAVSANFTGAC